MTIGEWGMRIWEFVIRIEKILRPGFGLQGIGIGQRAWREAQSAQNAMRYAFGDQ